MKKYFLIATISSLILRNDKNLRYTNASSFFVFFKTSYEGATIPTVYILTNQCMPEVLKIGVTENLEARIKSLDNTSMPLPFECFYAVEIAEAGHIERKIHQGLDHLRIRKNREFFSASLEQARSLLEIAEILGGQNVTPSAAIVDSIQDKQALESAKKRAQSFNFSMIDVSPGTTLTFKDGSSALPVKYWMIAGCYLEEKKALYLLQLLKCYMRWVMTGLP